MSENFLQYSVLKPNLLNSIKIVSNKKPALKQMNESITQLEKEISYFYFIVKEIEDITKES